MTPDPTKAKIIELCPDVIASQFNHINIDGPLITLAIVLRAIHAMKNEKGNYTANDTDFEAVMWRWYWKEDRWEDQTKETQLFVGSLLGVV